jgi:hypothetical protein
MFDWGLFNAENTRLHPSQEGNRTGFFSVVRNFGVQKLF